MNNVELEYVQTRAVVCPHIFGERACGVVPSPDIPKYAAHRRWAKDRLAPVPGVPGESTLEMWDNPSQTKRAQGKYWYMGLIDSHFGHFITESLSRSWWHLDNLGHGRRAVIVIQGGRRDSHGEPQIPELKDWQSQILDYLDISDPLIVDSATEFDDLVIPEQAALLFSDVHSLKYRELLQQHARNQGISFRASEKLFIRRPATTPPVGVIGESAISPMLLSAGFQEVRPERLSIRDQLKLAARAGRVVASEGSALHLYNLLGLSQTRVVTIQRLDTYSSSAFHATLKPYVESVTTVPPSVRFRQGGGSNKHLVIPDLAALEAALRELDPQLDWNLFDYQRMVSLIVDDLHIESAAPTFDRS